jgi:exosortase E/protease (VPEID-CTERM system)
MTALSESTSAGKPLRPSIRRWTIAGAILFAEYLVISVRFDSGTALARGGFWAIAGHVGMVAKYVAIVAASAIMLLPVDRPEGEKPPRVNAVALGVHGAFFLAFWRTTQAVFGGDAPAGSATLWFFTWAALGFGAAVALGIAIVGARGLSALVSPRAGLAMAALAAVAWFAGELTQHLWAQSSAATLRLVVTLLRSVFSGVTADPVELIVSLEGFSVWVAPQCSGLEGVGLVTVLMVGYLVVFRSALRFPSALLLLPFAIAAVWLLNGVRLAALIAIGARYDATLATNAFHARAGWVLFCVVALGVSALGRRSRFFSRDAALAVETENPAAPYLVPLLSLIATGLVTGMFADRVDLLYGLRVVVASVALYAYRRAYRGIRPDFSPIPVAAGVAVAAVWIALAVKHPEAPAAREAFRAAPAGSYASWALFRTLGSVLVVPVCEELAFRGYLLRRLVDRNFASVAAKAWTPVALVGSSLAFGLVHDRWIAASVAGVVYAAVTLRSGTLASAIVAHAITNGIIAAWVLVGGDLSLWL